MEKSDDFEYIFKVRQEDGTTKTYVLLSLDDYVAALQEAHETD